MAKKTDYTLNNFKLHTSAWLVASCLTLAGLPHLAQAAGLGKVTVFSALGQPLRAEVELSATRDELAGMKAQLASADAFSQAGLDYSPTLAGIKFSVDKRANGKAVIRLSSERPVNDPFVDLLLELNWPAGRLLREYTFLLDPPELAARGSAPVASATVKMPSAEKSGVELRSASPAEDAPAAKPSMSKPRAPTETKAEAKPEAESAAVREVKRGDTLHKIASETKPQGVSLEQMLVGLLRANQEAFDGGNMNRLKAGKILSVPEKSALESVSEAEAKKVVVTQSSDWNAYRRKLAGVAADSPVVKDAGKQSVSGKITPKVEDKAAPAAEPKDQVKVSRAELAAKAADAAKAKRTEEDLIAKEKALREASERLALLEKNVGELQKLVELKNKNLAEMQKQAAAKPAAPEPKPVEPVAKPEPVPAPPPVKPEPVPAPVIPPAVVEKPAEVKPVEAPPVKAEESKPVEPPKPLETPPPPKAEEAKPEVKPAPAAKPASPAAAVDEPGFLDGLLNNPVALAGGGGILALLAAYFVVKRRRQEVPVAASTLSPHSVELTANSVFRSTGGQSVDTSHTPATDFSQAGPGSIDTDEVDPVAEADVYMAYGRDAQAEEILLEAKQKDPKRYAIHLKLLEIYSNRKSVKQFETLATELYGETAGSGPDWEKALAMGVKLDPKNPLFGGTVTQQSFDADATVIVSSPTSMKDTVTMPGLLSQLAEAASNGKPPEPVSEPPAEPVELTSLDFDLGMDETVAVGAAAPMAVQSADVPVEKLETTITLPEPVVDGGALDFDLGVQQDVTTTTIMGAAPDDAVLDFNLPEPAASQIEAPAENETGEALDFDFGVETTPNFPHQHDASGNNPPDEVLDMGSAGGADLEFDVNLTESTVLGQTMQAPSFDMSSINLDLTEAPQRTSPVTASAASAVESASEPSAIELAQMSTVVNPDFSFESADAVADARNDLPEFDISPSEEVATKLDLAKAYEEMGDLEGARELLHEVLKEGDAAQREKAQAVLTAIGE